MTEKKQAGTYCRIATLPKMARELVYNVVLEVDSITIVTICAKQRTTNANAADRRLTLCEREFGKEAFPFLEKE